MVGPFLRTVGACIHQFSFVVQLSAAVQLCNYPNLIRCLSLITHPLLILQSVPQNKELSSNLQSWEASFSSVVKFHPNHLLLSRTNYSTFSLLYRKEHSFLGRALEAQARKIQTIIQSKKVRFTRLELKTPYLFLRRRRFLHPEIRNYALKANNHLTTNDQRNEYSEF